MTSNEELLSFLDLLDLDEEVVDTRLHSIMARRNYTNIHLSNALKLLRYKHLINTREKGDCDNMHEFDFVAKLIKDINEDIADNVCKITNIVLKLNPERLYCASEHLLMQILNDAESSCDNFTSSDDSEKEKSNTLLYLKVCDSILDAVIEKGEKLAMVFLEVPLQKILNSSDEQAKVHFVTSTVPKLFEGIEKYDILSEIWGHLSVNVQQSDKNLALKVLSSLSEYYLPAVIGKQKSKYESTVVHHNRFWDIVLNGLISDDPLLRKLALYLVKRAVDYVSSLSIDLNVNSNNETTFSWEHRKRNLYKSQWDDFFILMDSLEEKQSNIVLPSLQLFEKLSNIEHCWLAAAYNIGLQHDNNQVRLKCAEYRIKSKIKNDSEATALLKALDDIHFFENPQECKSLKEKLLALLKDDNGSIIHILKAIPQSQMSPIPFYHLSEIIADLDINITFINNINFADIIIEILKTSCNIIAIRKAIHSNIAEFVGKSCKNLHWRDVASIMSNLQIETKTLEHTRSSIVKWISDMKLDGAEKMEFYSYVTESHCNLDVGLLYLKHHYEDINEFIELVTKKLQLIQTVISRQYSNKIESFNDVLYILTLLNKCADEDTKLGEIIKIIAKEKTVVQYIFSLLSSDTDTNIDQLKALFNQKVLTNDGAKDALIELYKTSVILLKDPRTDLQKTILCMHIVNSLTINTFLIRNYKQEMLDFQSLLQIEKILEKREAANTKSLGRARNMFYEKHCETVYINLYDNDFGIDNHLQEIVDYVEKVMNCGGYGCLKWVLKIMNKILKSLIESPKIKLNINQFINRTWKEIEELKTNNQYPLCMKEFVNLITQEPLIHNPEYNNVVILYCNKLIEYGPVKNSPLYYLVFNLYDYVVLKKMNGKSIKEYGHLVYVLSEILLYCPVPRKDQRIASSDPTALESKNIFFFRIADNLALDILKNSKYGIEKTDIDLHFNFEIQHFMVSILSTITDGESLQVITSLIISKIDNIFKSKLRYHGNSQIHRIFQTGLQHLLLISVISAAEKERNKLNADVKRISYWCMELLGRLPHQLSVRICLEWYIALYFYKEKVNIKAELLHILQDMNLSLPSQFSIIYWLLKRKIANGSISKTEFEFVMDTLLSHTMGQMFNIRLLAQYLAIKLYKLHKDNSKYQYIVEVIEKTLEDNAKDKNFMKLKEDYFINEFDLLGNLTPYFIYYLLPRLCDANINEDVDIKFVLDKMREVEKKIEENSSFNEWVTNRKTCEELVKIELNRQVEKKIQDDGDSLGTIQKKYIPWKNMSDINVEKKRESPSDLILVASLIDKLPNLGGMARTSEVFGVKTYVIDSLRHLQDKQFQGLSVSAERWIDVEEVRPGQPLKDYLNRKKAEGYSVVAAEQTSTSTKLQTFKFPKKTLLLLGHEKEGIPCDLLPMMDHCVEIPQQGFVRSLNVHVTAAIFVWEYARQHFIK